MNVITFIGNKPDTNNYRVGVQGNNLVDTFVFILDAFVDGVDLRECVCKLNIEEAKVNSTFADITKNLLVEYLEPQQKLQITWKANSSVTSLGKVFMQLYFEDLFGGGLIVWQTQKFIVAFADRINIVETIERVYPDILTELNEDLEVSKVNTEQAVEFSRQSVELSNNAKETSELALSRVDTAYNLANSFNERVTLTEQKIATNEQSITDINSKIATNSSSISSINQSLSTKANQQALNDLSSKTSTIESNVTSLSSKTSTIETDLNGLSSKITNNSNSISTIESNVTSISSRTSTLENANVTINQSLNNKANSSDLNALNSRVESIEQEIGNVSQRLQTLNSGVGVL